MLQRRLRLSSWPPCVVRWDPSSLLTFLGSCVPFVPFLPFLSFASLALLVSSVLFFILSYLISSFFFLVLSAFASSSGLCTIVFRRLEDLLKYEFGASFNTL